MNMNPDLPPPPDPAPPTDPAARPAGLGLVEFVRASRPTAAYVCLGLSVLLLGATVALAARSLKRVAPADPPAVTLDPDAAKPAEVDDPKKGDYTTAAVGAAYAFLVAAAVGAFLLVGLPKPTLGEQRTEARAVLLAAGGLLGLGLMLFGAVFFWRWSESLAGWLDKNDPKQMQWVVIPLLMVVAGVGLIFAAVQPARAEERNNQLLRRLVYGANFALTVLLLLLVLVVANVVVARKVPNKLDTTETGFYTLADTTKAFLAKLPEPVALTVILPDSREREVNDVRQFAFEAQDAANGKLTARFVSPVTNKRELAELQGKYPRIDKNAYGLLLTAGADEKRHAFLPSDDLFDTDPRTGQLKGFAGEGKVMRELRFLADNEQKPAIYFTQGSGEPSITAGGAEPTLGGAAVQLKAFLDKAYLDVKPLVFPPEATAEVPADAAAVVVLEPRSPLPEAAVGALRKYMAEKKGKLVVAAGAVPGPGDKGVAKTGLEDLLREFNVRLGDRIVYSVPTEDVPDHRLVAVILNPGLQNPIAGVFGPPGRAVLVAEPREVEGLTAGPAFQASPLMFTFPGLRTWLSADRLGAAESNQALRDMFTGPDAARREAVRRAGLSQSARPVGAVVSEGPAARLVVFGNGGMFADRAAERGRPGATPITYDLMAASLDWLRDRPQLPTTVEAKVYKEYQFPEPAAVDTTRLVWFPLGLGLLVVAGFGAGVWVIRRK